MKLNYKNWPISNREKVVSNTQQLCPLKYHCWEYVVIPIRQPEGSEKKLYWHQLGVTCVSPVCLSCWKAGEELAHADFFSPELQISPCVFYLVSFLRLFSFPTVVSMGMSRVWVVCVTLPTAAQSVSVLPNFWGFFLVLVLCCRTGAEDV